MEKIPQIRRLRLPLRDQLWCNGAKGIEFKQCCHSVPLCRHLEKSRRRNGARTFRTFTGPNSAPISSHSKIPECSHRFAYKLLDFFPWELMPTRRSWTFVDCRANYIDKFCVGNYISTESVGVRRSGIIESDFRVFSTRSGNCWWKLLHLLLIWLPRSLFG